MPDLGAILTASVTPFASDGRVDEDAAVRLWRHLLDHGSHGVVVGGTTGEAATPTDEEHVALGALAGSQGRDRGTGIAGARANDTPHAGELAEQGDEGRADAIPSVAA